MKPLLAYLSSSIGKKQLVAASGLLLIGFLLSHLTGNLLMLKSPEAFNAYADFLIHHPLLIPAETGLVLLFMSHIAMGLKVSWDNWSARPEGYDTKVAEGGRSIGSRTMIHTGLLTLIFLGVHIFTLKISHPHGIGLFEWTLTYFRIPLYTSFYIFALLGLGIHLSHGFQSSFQTFGISHPKYTPAIKCGGYLAAVLVAAGFCVVAVSQYTRGLL